jgi:nitroreductase
MSSSCEPSSLVLSRAIAQRRSARAFDGRPLEADTLGLLLEAFRWSPSAFNRQPWRLIIATSSAARVAWDCSLIEDNRLWATRAPVKLIVVGNPDEQPDDFGLQRWMLDCGIALGQLLIQACEMKLTVRALSGIDEPRARVEFNIPAPYRVAAFVAAGYPGRIEDLPPSIQKKELRPRLRRPISEFLFVDQFEVHD